MSGFNPKWIVGKTVARVDMNPFSDGKGSTTFRPYIMFTDGSRVWFSTDETEVGEYGISVGYSSAAAPSPAPESEETK